MFPAIPLLSPRDTTMPKDTKSLPGRGFWEENLFVGALSSLHSWEPAQHKHRCSQECESPERIKPGFPRQTAEPILMSQSRGTPGTWRGSRAGSGCPCSVPAWHRRWDQSHTEHPQLQEGSQPSQGSTNPPCRMSSPAFHSISICCSNFIA